MSKELAANLLSTAESGATETLAAKLNGVTRQNAAKLVHEWLRDSCHEPDEADIEAALRLRDIYDCHACLNHVAQVYVKGIMDARGDIFGMREELTEREAAEIAERAAKPEKRLRVAGVAAAKTETVTGTKAETGVETGMEDDVKVRFNPSPDLTEYDHIIDVRSPEEFAEGHPEGAVNIPLSEYVEDPVAFVTERDAKILFICQKGIKSRIAAEAAVRAGFRSVESTALKM